MNTVKVTNLFYTQGSSDKQYVVSLKQPSPTEDGYLVEIAYGRRGAPLKASLKTKAPVSLEAAEKIFDKAVRAKTSKGYTEEESGVAFAGTEKAGDKTDFQPMLLNPVNEARLRQLIAEGEAADDAGAGDETELWYIQPKRDGERRYIKFENGTITAANRKGLQVGIQSHIAGEIQARFAEQEITQAELDCEDMGDRLYIFDVLSWQGQNLRGECLRERLWVINCDLCDVFGEDNNIVAVDPLINASVGFEELLAKLRAAGEEGIVAKQGKGTYTVGRPSSGGHALKLKFVESATCRVLSQKADRRSVNLELQDDGGKWIGVGSVTIPANHPIPPVGELVEVEYLYAYPNGGSLYQPVYKGVRTDQYEDACVTSQLKFKAEQQAA